MKIMLSGFEFATAYLDNILIKRGNKKHSQHILEIFKRIYEYEFKLRQKMQLFFWQK